MASATANPFGGSFYDPESQAVSGDWQGMDAKTARTIRHGFIRKVYGIIVAQLALTFAVAATMVSSEPVRNWSQEHALPLFVLSLVGSIGVLCYLGFKAGATQSVPSNYILLAILTVCESIAVGLICTLYESVVVVQALLATCLIVVALTIFAFQNSYDFTSMVGALFYVLIGFTVFGLLRLVFTGPLFQIIYASIGAIIFSLYIVVDTQLLIGRGKCRVEEDDYIFAAVMIYLDVINLFLYILQLLDMLRRRD
eukprot:GHVT01008510.1.p2 GENE.GHVT01008510.1~~GHVT01008510.1.p2  ORF type:complete len:254 (+),score=9.02 GHVT01008510.1:169-930(+)